MVIMISSVSRWRAPSGSAVRTGGAEETRVPTPSLGSPAVGCVPSSYKHPAPWSSSRKRKMASTGDLCPAESPSRIGRYEPVGRVRRWMDVTRAQQVIMHLVKRRPDLGRTQIVKLLYLVDLEAHRQLGKPITEVQWKFHHHGPYWAGFI